MIEFKGNQKAVVYHEKGNLLVSASAGSGKTFTMISRAIRLIREKKTKVSNILALTFTEAAALEMKEKLKKALFDLISDGGDEYISQISELDCADISTLHAFCGRIIREYFFEVGVSPDFKILDEDEAKEFQKIAIDNLFKKKYETKDASFLELLKRFRKGRKDENLKNFVISLYESARVEPDFDEILNKYELLYTEENLEKTVLKVKEYYNDRANALLDDLIYAKTVFTETGREKAVMVTLRLYEDILDTIKNDYYSLIKYQNYALSFMPSPFGTKLTAEEVFARETVKGVKEKFISLLKRFTKDICDREINLSRLTSIKEVSRGLSDLTKEFCREYEKVKKEENCLDFSDLEHFALKVLKNDNISNEVKNRYDFIFVDEYQDTNSVQELIISLVSRDNLFMVGDDKQSIYGFRGCRPEIFLNKEIELSKGNGLALRLNHNFRSAKNIINAVNSIFAFSMTKEHYGYSYFNKAMLVSSESFIEGADGRAELHLLGETGDAKEKKEKEPNKIYDLKSECFKFLDGDEEDKDVEDTALLIADIIEKEYAKEYYDLKEKRFRPVTSGDVVILSRSVETKYISRLVSTLYRLGIPVNSKVSVNALDYPETKTLVKFLELLENGRLDLPLVTVMKSAIGGFSDDELYDIASLYANEKAKEERKDAGFYEAYIYALNNISGKIREKLVSFDSYIKEIRQLKDFIGAKGVLDKVTSDCGFFNYILTLKEGKSIAQVVEYFISKSVIQDKILTVDEFLDKIYSQEKAFRVETSVGENAVRIMTIHASKGLEFPVVIVCGLEKKSNATDEEKEILFSKENGFITKFYNESTMLKEETPFRLLTKESLRENRLKEELRLFYVALTRASYSLHMVAKIKEDPRKDVFSGGERYIDFIPKSFPASVRSSTEFSFDAIKYEARKILVGKVDEERKEIIRRNVEFEYPFDSDVNVPLKTSVTSTLLIKDKTLIDQNETNENLTVIKVGDLDDESAEINKTSKERGTVAHKILEHYDFVKGDFKNQVKELIAKGLVSEELVKELNLSKLEDALNGEILSVLRDKKLYREAPFFANFKACEVLDTTSNENVLIQGIIDLLAVDKGECVIVDYKYSKLSPNKLKEKYQKQLDLYEKAVSRVLGLKVSAKYLFNILKGEVIKL